MLLAAVVMVMGTVMYGAEGPANGLSIIPVSIYRAITTMTTVRYGDIKLKTATGRLFTSALSS